jgi:uncharacterized protein (TIGR03067 family)
MKPQLSRARPFFLGRLPMRLPTLLLVAAAGLALVAASPGGDDAKKIQGTWDIFEYEIQGKLLPANLVRNVKVLFGPDKFKFDTGEPDIKEMTFKLDPAKKPKEIDVTADDAGQKTKYHGIYELDGDTLKMCVYATVAARPTAFKTNPDVKSFRMILKKGKGK